MLGAESKQSSFVAGAVMAHLALASKPGLVELFKRCVLHSEFEWPGDPPLNFTKDNEDGQKARWLVTVSLWGGGMLYPCTTPIPPLPYGLMACLVYRCTISASYTLYLDGM